MTTDCARCGTRHYGLVPPACVLCGAPFRTGEKRRTLTQRRVEA